MTRTQWTSSTIRNLVEGEATLANNHWRKDGPFLHAQSSLQGGVRCIQLITCSHSPVRACSGLSVVGLLGSGQYGRVVLCGRPSSTHPVVADLSNDQLLGVAPIQEPPKRRRSFLAKLVPGGSKQKGARESVELDERNERFALKILDKARFSRPKQERYALNERMAMRSLNHPFHLKFINA